MMWIFCPQQNAIDNKCAKFSSIPNVNLIILVVSANHSTWKNGEMIAAEQSYISRRLLLTLP